MRQVYWTGEMGTRGRGPGSTDCCQSHLWQLDCARAVCPSCLCPSCLPELSILSARAVYLSTYWELLWVWLKGRRSSPVPFAPFLDQTWQTLRVRQGQSSLGRILHHQAAGITSAYLHSTLKGTWTMLLLLYYTYKNNKSQKLYNNNIFFVIYCIL